MTGVSITVHPVRVEYIIRVTYPFGQYTEINVSPLKLDFLKKQLRRIIENRKMKLHNPNVLEEKNGFYLYVGGKKVFLNDRLLGELYEAIRAVSSGRLVA